MRTWSLRTHGLVTGVACAIDLSARLLVSEMRDARVKDWSFSQRERWLHSVKIGQVATLQAFLWTGLGGGILTMTNHGNWWMVGLPIVGLSSLGANLVLSFARPNIDIGPEKK